MYEVPARGIWTYPQDFYAFEIVSGAILGHMVSLPNPRGCSVEKSQVVSQFRVMGKAILMSFYAIFVAMRWVTIAVATEQVRESP